MKKIVGISGSLRRASVNTGLLRAARDLAPEGVIVEMADIADVPLYNGDVEADEGIPAAVERLKDAIAGADALLLVTPEYNNGIPGVMKNAIDWTSRPPVDTGRVFGGKPAALIGASPGRFGTILSQDAWLPVLHTLGVDLWHGSRLMVSDASTLFDPEGNLIDDKTRHRVAGFVAKFAASL